MQKRFEGKRAVVTGGAGFIGSNLAMRLANFGCELTVVDSFRPGGGANTFNLDPVQDRCRLVRACISDRSALEESLAKADFIFNLAGSTSHLDSLRDPQADLHANTVAHLSLLETLRKWNPGARIVYAGTRQAFGRPGSLPVTETHPSVPVDANGIHKLAGEQYHLVYHKVYGLPSACLRLTNTYGPRQLISHARQSFVGWFLNRALLGEDIELFGGGTYTRDFTFVEDAVSAFLLAATEERCLGKSWLLGGERASVRQVAETLARLGKVTAREVPYPEERKGIEIGDYYGDHSAFTAATGWRPLVSLEEGLARTFSYFQEHLEAYRVEPLA